MYILVFILAFILYQVYMVNRGVVIIKKDTHSNWWDFALHLGKTNMSRTVIFTESCLYKADSENDWNKLFGFSYGMHHQNSYRAAWRVHPEDNKVIELGIYTYNNGTRFYQAIGNCYVNNSVDIILQIHKDRCMMRTKDEDGHINRGQIDYGKNIKPRPGYYLFPYFGGQAKASHDMTFLFRR